MGYVHVVRIKHDTKRIQRRIKKFHNLRGAASSVNSQKTFLVDTEVCSNYCVPGILAGFSRFQIFWYFTF